MQEVLYEVVAAVPAALGPSVANHHILSCIGLCLVSLSLMKGVELFQSLKREWTLDYCISISYHTAAYTLSVTYHTAAYILSGTYTVCLYSVLAVITAVSYILTTSLSLFVSLTCAILAYIYQLIASGAIAVSNMIIYSSDMSKPVFSSESLAKTSQTCILLLSTFFLFLYICHKVAFLFRALTRRRMEPVRQARRELRRNNLVRDN